MKHTANIIKLNRGSELLVINVPNSTLAGFSIGVRAGHNYAANDKIEIAHLLEHLMFEANQSYPNGDDLAYELEKNGAYHNGNTGPIYVDFEYNFAKEFILETIGLALAQLVGPIFKDATIKKEKEVIKKELDPALDDPYEPCSYNLRNEIYKDANTVSGRIKSLDNISADDLKSYYDKYFVAENTKFLLYGDFTEAEINKYVDALNDLLKNYPKGEKQALRYKELKKYSKKIVAQDSKRVERNCLDFSFVNPSYPTSISPAIKVFYAIYNKGTYSKMFRRIRSTGIGYGFNGGYTIGRNYSELYFYNKGSLKNSLALFSAALEELKNILAGDVSDKELERARGYIIGELEKEYSTATDLAHWYVGEFADDDPLVDFNDYVQSVRELSAKDVIKAANQFVITDGWVLSLLGSEIKKQENKYRQVLNKYFG